MFTAKRIGPTSFSLFLSFFQQDIFSHYLTKISLSLPCSNAAFPSKGSLTLRADPKTAFILARGATVPFVKKGKKEWERNRKKGGGERRTRTPAFEIYQSLLTEAARLGVLSMRISSRRPARKENVLFRPADIDGFVGRRVVLTARHLKNRRISSRRSSV